MYIFIPLILCSERLWGWWPICFVRPHPSKNYFVNREHEVSQHGGSRVASFIVCHVPLESHFNSISNFESGFRIDSWAIVLENTSRISAKYDIIVYRQEIFEDQHQSGKFWTLEGKTAPSFLFKQIMTLCNNFEICFIFPYYFFKTMFIILTSIYLA